MITDESKEAPSNREHWLTDAVKVLRPIIQASMSTDEVWPENIAVSCGWPNTTPRKTIGQCFTVDTGNGTVQMFISPLLVDPVKILATLLHELIHAVDDCKSGHKGRFAKMAKDCGLTGKMTATEAGPQLTTVLEVLAMELGVYPHSGIKNSGPKKKVGSRMIKLECSSCETVSRTTQKWLDMWGYEWPCPCGDGKMEAAQ